VLELLLYCPKTGCVGEFQHTPLWKKQFLQCSTPSVSMRFCGYIPSSLRNKNKMMHHLCILEKLVFLASKTLLSPIGIGKKNFFINFKLHDLTNGKA
jgi:hypothetical protein